MGARDTGSTSTIGRPFDDRTSYEVAAVLVRQITALDDGLRDEDHTWDEFADWLGPNRREYVDAVRRTEHSVFYYDLQALYEFGMERTGREDLPLLAGRALADTIYEENLSRLLQAAIGSTGSFQHSVGEVFKTYLYRYTGTRYLLETRWPRARKSLSATSRRQLPRPSARQARRRRRSRLPRPARGDTRSAT